MSLVRPDGNWYLEKDDDHPIGEPSRQDGRFSLDDMSEPDLDLIARHDEVHDSSSAKNDSGPDDYEEHREGLKTGDAYLLNFRCQPNDALEQVRSAAARAVAVMPQLRSLTVTINVLTCPRTDDDLQQFELAYDAIDSQHLDPDARVARLQWTAPSEWEMSEDLGALWREVVGPTGEITYEHW